MKVTTIVLIFLIFVAGCSKPPKDREQVVFEATCGERLIIVYQPVNTWGIQYDEKGRKISGLQNCTAVPIGKADRAGSEILMDDQGKAK